MYFLLIIFVIGLLNTDVSASDIGSTELLKGPQPPLEELNPLEPNTQGLLTHVSKDLSPQLTEKNSESQNITL